MKQNTQQVILPGVGAVASHAMRRDHNKIEFVRESRKTNRVIVVTEGRVNKHIAFIPAEGRGMKQGERQR